MKVTLLPSAHASRNGVPAQYATSYLVNETVAIDAGCLGFFGEAADQAKVKHLLITHSHIDHVASLPIFVENIYDSRRECVRVYGNRAVLDSLQKDIFNNRLWPDFVALSTREAPFLTLHEFEPGESLVLEGLTISPVAVNHTVPTQGYVISDGQASIIIVSDTGPTDEVWQIAHKTPNLRAVFIEVTFPNALADLAKLSKHLTPEMLAQEARKLPRGVPLHVVHMKARFREEIVRELAEQPLPFARIAEFGVEYEF